MIDAHILVSEWTPREWVNRAVQSVELAASEAPFDVEVRVCPGVPGHIGKARQAAYRKGTNPYVVAIDDDDWVAPEFFQVLDAVALNKGVAGIFIRSVWAYHGQYGYPEQRHKLAAISRTLVESLPFEQRAAGEGDMVKRAVERTENFIDLREWVYYRRIRNARHSSDPR